MSSVVQDALLDEVNVLQLWPVWVEGEGEDEDEVMIQWTCVFE